MTTRPIGRSNSAYANGAHPGNAARTPVSYFSVGQRLFRGYGPVAVLVALLVILALAVPSKVPASSNAAVGGVSGGNTAGSGSAAGGSGASHNGLNSTASAATPSAHSGVVASSGSGGGAGGSGGTGGTAGRAGTKGHTIVTAGRVESCGGQKLQVPGDPYSPPCELWNGGNNLGATAPGVTSNSITVTVRLTSDQSFQQTLAQLAGAQLQDTNADNERTILALVQYFNSHFQFYGRKINIKFFNGQGSLANELLGTGQAQAEADALTAKQLGAFADITAESEPYSQDLANQHIMAFGDPYLSTGWHQQNAPYTWSVATEGTYVAQTAADYAVEKLCPAGSPAKYAGGNLKNQPRKFALLAPENSWYQQSVQVASQYMIAHHCGNSSNIVPYTYTLDLGTESQQAANLIAKLKAEGVTTVFCGCDPIFPVYLSGQGSQQQYFPEVIVIGTALTDADYVGQLYNQQFWSHAFGISPNAPEVPYTQTIGYAAYKTVRSDEPSYFVNLIYAQLDQLAIGLQMAGPDLTPQSFQQGMFNYPPRQGPMGLWGWSPEQFTVPDDVREICWDPNAVSPFNGKQGAYEGTSNQRWTFGKVPPGPPGCGSWFPAS